MSTEKAQSRDANPGEDATKTGETAAYWEYGKQLLEDKPDLTPALFAGELFAEFDMAPEPALDLYDELTEDRGGDE